MSMPESPGRWCAMTPATSPSPISLMRGTGRAHLASISSAWRGRSRMQTTRSATSTFLALARSFRFSAGVLSRSTMPSGRPPTDGDLVHVDVGRVEEAAVLGHGDDGQRIGQALGGDGRALERIERDVDLAAAFAGADLLADIEHRRLVALALADHHRTLDGKAVQRLCAWRRPRPGPPPSRHRDRVSLAAASGGRFR